MHRRAFLRTLAAAAAGSVLDPELGLWIPGRRSFFDMGGKRIDSELGDIDAYVLGLLRREPVTFQIFFPFISPKIVDEPVRFLKD